MIRLIVLHPFFGSSACSRLDYCWELQKTASRGRGEQKGWGRQRKSSGGYGGRSTAVRAENFNSLIAAEKLGSDTYVYKDIRAHNQWRTGIKGMYLICTRTRTWKNSTRVISDSGKHPAHRRLCFWFSNTKHFDLRSRFFCLFVWFTFISNTNFRAGMRRIVSTENQTLGFAVAIVNAAGAERIGPDKSPVLVIRCRNKDRKTHCGPSRMKLSLHALRFMNLFLVLSGIEMT